MKYLAILLLPVALLISSCREKDQPDLPPAFNTTEMQLVLTCADSAPTRIFFDPAEPGYYAVALGNGMKIPEGVSSKEYCNLVLPQINPGPGVE